MKAVRENGDVVGSQPWTCAAHGGAGSPLYWFPRLSWCAGWLSFAASVMALPLLAGEASAQAVPRVLWSGAVHQDITEDTETQYNI